MVEDHRNLLIGDNIRALRQAARMTQEELAERLGSGFRQQTILKIEKGTRPLKLTEAADIADALGVTLEVVTAGGGQLRMSQHVLRAQGRLREAERAVLKRKADLTEAETALQAAQLERDAAGDAFDKARGVYVEAENDG